MKRAGHQKHIPERTCIACRQIKPKRELIRIVHSSNDRVEIDTGGKKSGRGVYLCNSKACWENGLKWERLEHTLKARITQQERLVLIEYSKTCIGNCSPLAEVDKEPDEI